MQSQARFNRRFRRRGEGLGGFQSQVRFNRVPRKVRGNSAEVFPTRLASQHASEGL